MEGPRLLHYVREYIFKGESLKYGVDPVADRCNMQQLSLLLDSPEHLFASHAHSDADHPET